MQIKAHLRTLPPPFATTFMAQTASTNDDVARALAAGQTHAAVQAGQQTAGRGRRGRAWQAPANSAFLASVGWLSHAPIAAHQTLPLWAGIALAQVLHSHAYPARLKWPNDLWLGGAKLGGILLESKPAAGQTALILGVGINYTAHPSNTPYPSTALHRHAPIADASALSADLLAAMMQLALNPPDDARLVQQFAAVDALLGREVVCSDGLAGIAQGVNAQGHLRLQTAAGLRLVHSGEVSVRAL